MYIEQRHRKWIARHDIPKKLKELFGNRTEFNQILRATDRAKAVIEAKELEIKWLRQIDRARRGLPPEPPEAAPEPGGRAFDHQGWRKWVKGAKGDAEHREREQHAIEAIEQFMGLTTWQELEEPGNEDEREQFGQLVALATGDQAPFLESLDAYVASLRVVETSRDLKEAHLKKFGETFKTTADVTTDSVQDWITAKVKADNASKLTIHKYVGTLRDYLRYIAKHHKIRVAVEWNELDLEGREKLDKLPYPRKTQVDRALFEPIPRNSA